jgi:type IV pilus assembly protein PilQ
VRTNTLLIKDTNTSLANVRLVLLELDIPVRQVLIESRIVVALDDFSKELGVRFGLVSNSYKGNSAGDGALTAGNLDGVVELANNDPLSLLNGLNVNLPVQNPAGSFALALAKLPLGTLLEMELSAAQVEGRGETISSPRVITADGHTATISAGTEVPYLELSDGDATLKFRDAVLSLDVTPQITPDDRVIMDLDVHKDDIGETVSFGAGLSAPSIDTKQVQSQLLVDNGQTVVLGGIYETLSREEVTRVPFFSDLPLLGFLFKTTRNTDDRSELLIFVTPKILKDGEIDLDI